MHDRPRLAIWKFASCDGCQLALLDCEDELLEIAGRVEIAHFLEASSRTAPGPYDVSLVEGSISTPADLDRIRRIRDESTTLVAIGACATAGGIQSLRNFADAADYARAVYPRPEWLDSLPTATPIADHVRVDYELRGCPIDRRQLLELLSALLAGRRPELSRASVCVECKRRSAVCVMVAHGLPCLGPVTQAGCGAVCPAYHRGCYGCHGPVRNTAIDALERWWGTGLGVAPADVERARRTFNAWAPELRDRGDGR
jgi:sulfhydrogenase subunit delta